MSRREPKERPQPAHGEKGAEKERKRRVALVEEEEEEEDDDDVQDSMSTRSGNKFANDGSFLEMFKRLQEEKDQQKEKQLETGSQPKETSSACPSGSEPGPCPGPVPSSSTAGSSLAAASRSATAFVSGSSVAATSVKRRKVLKVGVIKRDRREEGEEERCEDAWSQYMSEVRKYKDKYGDDSDKNRPLVKTPLPGNAMISSGAPFCPPS